MNIQVIPTPISLNFIEEIFEHVDINKKFAGYFREICINFLLCDEKEIASDAKLIFFRSDRKSLQAIRKHCKITNQKTLNRMLKTLCEKNVLTKAPKYYALNSDFFGCALDCCDGYELCFKFCFTNKRDRNELTVLNARLFRKFCIKDYFFAKKKKNPILRIPKSFDALEMLLRFSILVKEGITFRLVIRPSIELYTAFQGKGNFDFAIAHYTKTNILRSGSDYKGNYAELSPNVFSSNDIQNIYNFYHSKNEKSVFPDLSSNVKIPPLTYLPALVLLMRNADENGEVFVSDSLRSQILNACGLSKSKCKNPSESEAQAFSHSVLRNLVASGLLRFATATTADGTEHVIKSRYQLNKEVFIDDAADYNGQRVFIFRISVEYKKLPNQNEKKYIRTVTCKANQKKKAASDNASGSKPQSSISAP